VSEPIYLMHSFDPIFPEDDRDIEITADEFKALSQYGRYFHIRDARESDPSRRKPFADLLSDIVDQRAEADRRPSEIDAADRAGTMLTCEHGL